MSRRETAGLIVLAMALLAAVAWAAHLSVYLALSLTLGAALLAAVWLAKP